MDVLLVLEDPAGTRIAEAAPRTMHVRAGLGALPAECRAELYAEDAPLPAALGARLLALIDNRLVFDGPVVELRTDTMGQPRGLRARREPERVWNERVTLSLQDSTVGEALDTVVAALLHSPVTYTPTHAFVEPVEALGFVNYPLFAAVELLARLAGNALWDLPWDGGLRFRPSGVPPDHVLTFDPRRHALKVWQNTDEAFNYFVGHGGIVDGNEFLRVFYDEAGMERDGQRPADLFFRPIFRQSDYQRLRDAVLAEAPLPGLEKYLDVFGGAPEIAAGDVLELRGSPLPAPGGAQLVRVKEIEHDWRSDALVSRLWLARGRENASRFFSYMDHEATEADADWVGRRLGAFELDFSALDSSAQLDG